MKTMSDFTCQCPGPFGTARYTMIDAARMQFLCKRCNSQLVPAEPISVFAEARKFANDVDDDTSNVAPGASESDDPIQNLLNREADIRRRREAGEFNVADYGPWGQSNGVLSEPKKETRKERLAREKREKEQHEAANAGDKSADPAPDETPDLHPHSRMTDPTPAGFDVEAALDGWRQLGQKINAILAPLRVNGIDKDVEEDGEPYVRIRYAHGIVYEFDIKELDDPDFRYKLNTFAESWKARKNAILDFRARGRRYLLNAELVAGIDYRD